MQMERGGGNYDTISPGEFERTKNVEKREHELEHVHYSSTVYFFDLSKFNLLIITHYTVLGIYIFCFSI